MKRFKYSIFFKIICVLISFVSFFAAVRIGVINLFTAEYINESYYGSSNGKTKINSTSDWTSNYEFLRAFEGDIGSIMFLACEDEETDKFKAALAEGKQTCIEKALEIADSLRLQKEEYEARQKREAEENTADYDYDENDEPYETETTTVAYYDDDHNEFTSETDIIVDGKQVGVLDIFADDTKRTLEERFDNCSNIWLNDYIQAKYSYKAGISSELNYTVSYKGEEYSSKNGADIKKARSSGTYFILSQGKVESKGICDDVIKDTLEYVKPLTGFEKITVIAYLNTSAFEKTGFENLVNQSIKNNDLKYSQLYHMYNLSRGFYANTARCFAIAVALLLISIVFALVYFEITGKKSAEEKTKQRFYDFVPLEVGLAFAGTVIAGILYLLFEAYEQVRGFSEIGFAYIVISVAVVCFAALFVLCASNVRYFRSGKKAYKHFLAYWFLYAIGKAFKAIKKLFIRIKDAFKSVIKTIFYRPTKFLRNVVVFGLLLIILDLLLICLFVVCLLDGNPLLALLCLMPIIPVNAYAFYRVCKYVKNLDTLIDASSRRDYTNIELEKLDNSLRVLALNMKYSNSELQSAIDRAVKDERLRTELITNVSHDLKTPLTSIILYADLLSKCDIDDEKAKEYIQIIDEKGNKLKKLIDDLIEASKVTSGNVTVNPSVINLSELCLQATVDAQSDFEKNGLELVVKSGRNQTIVYADGVKTNRIIENLLSNARKYSARYSRVYVTVSEDENNGIVEIKNISAQPLDIMPDELIERFVRGDKSRNQEGNGLGLSIAKELCKLQNGRLELQIDGDMFKARVYLPKKSQ
ncbi:MAG: HAMP domain-containing histidine kinase [Clostridia bacterium]|nr:HAMP domain-containing histidine kinase [Clostridia bacterium]